MKLVPKVNLKPRLAKQNVQAVLQANTKTKLAKQNVYHWETEKDVIQIPNRLNVKQNKIVILGGSARPRQIQRAMPVQKHKQDTKHRVLTLLLPK